MNWIRRMELLESPSASLFYSEATFCKPWGFPFAAASFLDEQEQLDLALDVLSPPCPLDLPIRSLLPSPGPSPLDFFESAADLVQIAPLRRLQERAEAELCLRGLCDRVAALEAGFDRKRIGSAPRDRTYKWTAEIGAPGGGEGGGRKYKWTAEAKAGGERSLKWTAEIGGKGKVGVSRTYTFQASSAPAAAKKAAAAEKAKKEKKEKKRAEVKGSSAAATRLVEITDGPDYGAVVLRQVGV